MKKLVIRVVLVSCILISAISCAISPNPIGYNNITSPRTVSGDFTNITYFHIVPTQDNHANITYKGDDGNIYIYSLKTNSNIYFFSNSSNYLAATLLKNGKTILVYQKDINTLSYRWGKDFNTEKSISVPSLSDPAIKISPLTNGGAMVFHNSGSTLYFSIIKEDMSSYTHATYTCLTIDNADASISSTTLLNGNILVAGRPSGNGTYQIIDTSENKAIEPIELFSSSNSSANISAVTLRDGRVLIAYRKNTTGFYSIIDPNNPNNNDPENEFATVRDNTQVSATTLPDGRVLVAYPNSAAPTVSYKIIDPNKKSIIHAGNIWDAGLAERVVACTTFDGKIIIAYNIGKILKYVIIK